MSKLTAGYGSVASSWRAWVRGVVMMAAAVVALTFAPASGPATAGLVAAFSFDEGSGTTVADQSGNGNNGTVANTTWASSGKYGKALSFNGTSSRVTVPNSASLQLTTGMTLEAWVNPTTVSSAWRDVIEKGNDNYYLMGTTDHSGFPAGGGTFASTNANAFGTAALATNAWSYLASSYDGANLRLYLNGTLVTTVARTGAITTSTNALTIGSDPFWGQYFNGMIDDLRIYNTALTQAQIQTDMTTPVAPAGPDTTPPSAPGTLSATAISATRIDLSWGAATDNTAVTGYHIERCQGTGCTTFAEIATTTTATSYSDTTTAAGTSYSYRIRANDAVPNLGPYSNTATTTTPNPDLTPPSAPGTLSANAISATRIDLSWGAATDNTAVTGYQIERCQGTGCNSYTQIATTNGTTTSYSDTTTTANTSYSYRVRANDAVPNLGPYSNTATTTTPIQTGPTPVAAYAFDEGSGTTVADQSGNGNNGTVANTTWASSGKYGKALSFNGTSSRVTVPNSASLQLTTGMTLEAWVNPTTVSSAWRDVIEKGNDNYYLMGTTDHSGFPAGGGTFASTNANAFGTAALATNAWSYLASSYDGANLRLYLNGTLVTTVARTGAITTSTNALTIGSDPFWGQYFNGMIDDLRIYNTALTQAQIQTDMTTPVAPAGPDTTPPSAPGTLSATAISATRIDLSWGAATDNTAVTGYHIERCQGTGCTTFAEIATTTTATSYSDTTTAAGTSYSYRIRANDAVPNLGPYSNTATTTTPNPDLTPPSAPGTLSANAISATRIDLSWGAATDNTAVTGYQIERCQGTGCNSYTQIATTNGTTTSYSDTTTTANTSYSYRVRANDAVPNLGPYSNTATLTTPSGDTTPPSAPGTLTSSTVGTTEIDLNWGAATDDVGVAGYRIDRCQGAGCTNFSHLVQLSGTGTTYQDVNLSPGTTYGYQVRAVDAAGNLGPVSNTTSATTQAAPTAGLVAAYSFDEGSGTTVTDSSGNGNNGTVANTTWASSGKYGKALSFNGTSSRVTVPNSTSLQLSTGMTLEAWVNPTTASSAWRDVIEKGNDNYYLMATTDQAGAPSGGGTFGGANANALAPAILPTNTWTYLATSYDGANLRFYLNGTLVTTVATTGAITSSSNALTIGSDPLWGQYFSGMIDEVRIYNAAITASQIQSDMNSTGTAVPSAPANLTTTVVNSTQIDLAWGASSDSVGVTGYRVERCQGASCTNFAQIATPTGTTYSDTGLSPSTSYSYRVRAIDGAGTLGPYSITATGFTGLLLTPLRVALTPGQTQQFTASLPGGGSVAVDWSVDGIAGGATSAGTITGAGLYTAPPAAGTHTIAATPTGQSVSVSATAFTTNYAGMFTFHNDNLRTGENLNETVLTPANVNSSSFGKLFSLPLDGISHASPLYVENVSVPNQGTHNLVYIATEHDSVYAYDADGRSTTPVWQDSFIDPAHGVTTVSTSDVGECCDITPEIGITSTPVIDRSTNTIYVVAKTKEVVGGNTTFVQRLHALDLSTGAEKFGGPVVIQASVPGTGNGSVNGQLAFNALRENQRTGLLLLNGVVYFGFSSHGDNQPYHGWIMGYDATTLRQTLAFCTTPDQEGAGVWMSGDGIASDATGSLYYITGDGEFDGSREWGDTYARMTTAGVITDFFTPFDQNALNQSNHDLGSGGALLLPDQPGAHPHEMLGSGKNGTIYLVDRDNMGQYHTTNNIIQTLPNVFPFGSPEPGNFSAPVYYGGYVIFGPLADNIQAFKLTNGLLSTSPTLRSAATFSSTNRGGAAMAISANGSTNGILWANRETGTTSPGVLYAFDPTNSTGGVLKEIYDSTQAGSRDALGVAAKFTIPLVANGKVFVVGASALTVYGLLP